MFHTVYKTTNLTNGKFYIGVHSASAAVDSYLGSGPILKQAVAKYGVESFSKEILAYCDTREEALTIEASLVTEALTLDPQCYNITIGGGAPPRYEGSNHPMYGTIRPEIKKRMQDTNPARMPHVKAKHADTVMVHGPDGQPMKIKKEIWNPETHPQINKGMIVVKDSGGNIYRVSKEDPRYISGELVHTTKGRVLICPYCDKSGGNSMKRWHFNNCKLKGDSV
jgi:hypothetical protein